jgi:hypothetical protein
MKAKFAVQVQFRREPNKNWRNKHFVIFDSIFCVSHSAILANNFGSSGHASLGLSPAPRA